MKPTGSDKSAIVEMLQKAPLWSGLTEKELKVIARSFKELKYETGDIILRKGEAGVGFYLIADGTAEVRSEGKVLSKLGPGQFFGEMSILDGQPRSADVVALEPSRCLALTSWSFKSIVSNHPKMALKLLQESVRRISMNTQTLGEQRGAAEERGHLGARLADTLKSDAGLAMASQAEAAVLLAGSDRKGVDEAYLKSLGLWEKAGWPYYRAKALVAYSEALAQENPEESRKRLDQAAAIFRKLGAKRDIERIEAKLNVS